MSICCKPYPSDIRDEEWALIAPHLLLQREDAGQCEHDLREVFNGLRYIVKTGAPWRWMPNDPPPWAAVYQQTQRWLGAGCLEALVDDLWAVLRLAAGREAEPTAAIIDSRTLRSTPESGEQAGYDGGKRKKGSKIHNSRRQAGSSRSSDFRKPNAAWSSFPRHWVVERSFAWATRFQRLVKDYERYAETVAGFHVAFACLMMKRAASVTAGS